jgi:hypothetical protein
MSKGEQVNILNVWPVMDPVRWRMIMLVIKDHGATGKEIRALLKSWRGRDKRGGDIGTSI